MQKTSSRELKRISRKVYTEEETELLKAVERWRVYHKGQWPAVTTILKICKKLGYKKVKVEKNVKKKKRRKGS